MRYNTITFTIDSLVHTLRSRAETDTVKISTLRCYPFFCISFKFMKVLLAVGCCW